MTPPLHTLASLRTLRRLTRATAAARLGISAPTLTKYEHDATKIPADLLGRAADLYGCPPEYIHKGPAEALAAPRVPAA